MERGGKTSIISSQELVKGMDESGAVSAGKWNWYDLSKITWPTQRGHNRR